MLLTYPTCWWLPHCKQQTTVWSPWTAAWKLCWSRHWSVRWSLAVEQEEGKLKYSHSKRLNTNANYISGLWFYCDKMWKRQRAGDIFTSHCSQTWKSRSASSWFCMMGKVLISFSVFMVRITPSALKHTQKWWTKEERLHVLRAPSVCLCRRRTLFSSWWSPLRLVYKTWIFHSGIGCSVWWRLTCCILERKALETNYILLTSHNPFLFSFLHQLLLHL